MRKIVVVTALLALAGCSGVPLRRDPMFTCQWARFRDYQESAAARVGGTPAQPHWADLICRDQRPWELE